MARGRMISTDTALDPELNGLSLPALALYLMAIPHLDRDGLIDGHPLALTAKAAPLRYDLRDAEPLIQEWIDAGLVQRYPFGARKAVCFFHGFRKHQQRLLYDREPASRFPPPPGWTRTPSGLVPDDPEQCLRLAEATDDRSAYHRALLTAAGYDVPNPHIAQSSRGLREELMNTSRDPRLEENTNGVVVDHHTISTTGVCVREGGLGETGTGGVATILADYTPDQLIALAHALGIELGLHAEWNGWQRQLRQWQPDELYLLIGWCAFYRANSHLLDAVRNLPGIIRKNIKDHSPAYLRPSDLDQLAQDAATIIMAETI